MASFGLMQEFECQSSHSLGALQVVELCVSTSCSRHLELALQNELQL